jgi:hypothetical protein
MHINAIGMIAMASDVRMSLVVTHRTTILDALTLLGERVVGWRGPPGSPKQHLTDVIRSYSDLIHEYLDVRNVLVLALRKLEFGH